MDKCGNIYFKLYFTTVSKHCQIVVSDQRSIIIVEKSFDGDGI